MNFFTRRSSAAATLVLTLVAALALPLATAQRPVSGSTNVPTQTPRTNPTVQDGGRLNAPGGSVAALPLASIGRQVGWKIPPDDFRINVPAAAAGRETSIEVFSPEINRNDYANARDRVTYYGDELYGKTATLETQFRLTDSKNTPLFSRSFGTGLQHGYEALYQGTLPAGIYPFRVLSEGNGKNSFALRATNGLRVEASQFTVTARGLFNQDQLVAFVQIDRSAIGKTVELANYDADGASEIVLTLVAPDGRRFPLTASEDTSWAANKFKVEANLVGNWKIVGRILPTTRQFSNSFAFRLRIDDKPLFSFLPGFTPTRPAVVPLKVDVVDTKGNPIPGSSYTVTGVGGNRVAQPVLPNCWTPVSANILAGAGTVNSNTRVTITSNSGHIRFVADCPKAKVQVVAVAQVCGQRVPVNGAPFTTSTGARGTTPASLEITPGSITVTGAAQNGANTTPVTVTAARDQITTVTLVYDVSLMLELQPNALDLTVGETSTVTAVVNSVFATPVPVSILVQLPDGLEALGATTLNGTVSAATPLVLRIPVKATKPVANGTVRASLEPNCGVTAVSSVRIVAPPTDPAKIALTKTVDRDLVKTGERVNYTITVTNTGGSTARNVRLTDVLPTGLAGENLDQTFDLEPLQSRRFSLPATVTQQTEGEIINVARVLWAGETLEADAMIRIEPPPPPPPPPVLTLTKTVDRDLVRPNDRATYTITVTNTGGSAARDVLLSDVLPEGVRGDNLEQRFDLNVGQARTFRIPVTVTRATAGEIVNTARVTWSGDPLSASATMRVEIPVEPQPVLTLTKTADRDLVRAGDRVTFTITVSNMGAGVARDVRLTDILPTGLVGTNLEQTFLLQPGQSRTFRLTATVAAGAEGEITNIARVTWSGEPLTAAATVRVEAPVVVPPPVLALTKTVDRDLVRPGDRATYTITVTNTGGSVAKDVLLTDVLPEGVTGQNLEQRFDLNAGQSRVFRIPVTVTRNIPGEIVNTARVTWSGSPLSASATMRVEVPPVLTLTKVVDRDLVRLGDRATYTITVTNTGGSVAKDVLLTDVLPEGVAGQNLEQRFDLNPGQGRTFRIPVTVTRATAGEIVNTARVTWSGEPLSASATMRVEVPVVVPPAALSLTKVVDKDLVEIGERVNFTITVTNTGGTVANNVRLTDTLPTGLTGANLSQTFTLQPGQSRTVQLPATVVQGATGQITNTARVEWSGEPLTASASVRVKPPVVVVPQAAPQIDLAIQKRALPTNLRIGDKTTFLITVTNNGPDAATNVVMSDPLPIGLEYDAATSSQGEVSFANGVVTASLGDLARGRSASIQLVVIAREVGTFNNVANVQGDQTETTLDNNRAQASVTVTPVIDLALSKSVTPTEASTNQEVVYRLVVQNLGPSSATEVVLTDPVPEGLQYIGATTSQGVLGFENGTVTATIGSLPVGQSATVTVRASTTRAGTFTNIATVRAAESESRLDNNTARAQVVVTAPVIRTDLEIAKSVAPTRVAVGQGAIYTIVVRNNGPQPATNVVMNDPVPAGLEYVSAASSKGSTNFAGGILSANLGTLAVGESATITVRVNATRAGTFNNTATVAGLETETRLDNNSASAVLEAFVPTGILNVSAASLNCATKAPITGTAFTINGTRYTTPARIELPIGEYTIVPETLADATAAQPRVTVVANQASTAELVYNVQSRVEVNPRILSVTAGQNITVRAIASSNFPYPIATTIALRLPEQVSPTGTITKTGTVSANAPLVLEVPVRALRPVNSVSIAASLEPNCAADTGNLQILATPLPAQRRETQVVLLAKLAEIAPSGSRLILSDRIPAGSSYISGSSSLVANPTFGTNTPTHAAGAPLANPYTAGDRLFWVVPVTQATTYGVTYRLAHTGALQMPEDRVAAFLVLPTQRCAGAPRNAIAADSPMGRLLGAGELRQLQGDPSVLGLLAQALPFGTSSSSTAPRPVGGFATSLRVTPLRATTDSADQPTIQFEAFDKDGLPAKDEFVTVQVNADPADPDAAPALAGYQVRLQDGVGYLRLQSLQTRALDTLPQNTLRVDARIANPNGIVSSSHDFKVDDFSVLAQNPIDPNTSTINGSSRPTILVGMLSGLVRYDFGTGNFSADGGLRLFLRGDTALGLLTLGINWQADYDPTRAVDPFRLSGSLMPPANPYEYLPLLGDSSVLGSDVRSSEGFYARLEGGRNFVMFGQFTPQFSGVLTNYNLPYNGISSAFRTDGFGISAFATDTPNTNNTVRLPANGTDLYFLPATNINSNSEQISVVVYSKDNPALRLSRQVLVRNTDYRIDYETGLVRLTKAITSRDANLNPQFLEISYGSAAVGRDFRFGVQASLGSPELNLTATAVQFRNGTLGNNSSFLLGAGVNVQSGGFQLGVEVAQSGVFGDPTQSNIGLGAQLNWTIGSFQARVRYQDLLPNYIDPETNTAVSAGRSLVAGMTLGDPNGLSFNANLDHTQSYVSNSGATGASAGVQLALGDGWSIGLGLQGRYSFPTNLFELFGTAGINANLGGIKLGLLQRVPLLGLNGSYGDTEASLELPLGAGFSVLLKDKLTYEPNGIRQQINFGVKASFTNSDLLRVITGNTAFVPGQFGQTNVSATYDLVTTDGNAGRARLGLDTLIPLGNNFSTQLGAEAVFEPTGGITGSASIGVLYSDDAIKGLGRAQFGFAPTGLRQVYTAGIIAQLGDEFVISPKVEYAIDPAKAGEQQGLEFSIAGAYRTDDLSILTNHRAKTGFYSLGDDYVEGEVQFGYQANERLYIRLGAQYRNVIDSGIFTGLVSGGFSWFVTDTFAVGAQAGYYFQPITNFSQIGFGVEASLKLVDRLLFTLGYNVLGFNGALGNAFRPGLYFRLDWKLDENMFR